MDRLASRSGSPTPLQTMSPDRVNQQQGSLAALDASVASVTDKISQFNTLAMQSKQLERKTADAALKRAMLGREEAETEMRRFREEARQLRKQLDDSRDRERRVGERLETVMALWEKEIRRARKETFRSQSAIVKLQEDLKAARASARTADEALAHEKARSTAREQEAFQARYDLVGCQEALEQALQRAKLLEQERDAFRSLARSTEDVARIASEGRLPLPPPDPEEEAEAARAEAEAEAKAEAEAEAAMSDGSACEDEKDGSAEQQLAVPKRRAAKRLSAEARVSSASRLSIRSSAASEAEIDELTRLWQWEKQRADRASELVDYLEAECHLRACSCMRKRPRASVLDSARKRPALDIGDGGDRIILSDKAAVVASPAARIRANLQPDARPADDAPRPSGPRRSTIFVPEEGTFRTVSQQIAEEMEQAVAAVATAAAAADTQAAAAADTQAAAAPPAMPEAEDEAPDADTTVGDVTTDTAFTAETTDKSIFARTPSVEPPAFAQQRTSLLSLLDAPHRQDAEPPLTFCVPTTPGPDPAAAPRRVFSPSPVSDAGTDVAMRDADDTAMEDGQEGGDETAEARCVADTTDEFRQPLAHNAAYDEEDRDATPQPQPQPQRYTTPSLDTLSQLSQPHTAPGGLFSTATTTTKVPLRAETTDPSLAQRIMAAQRTPTHRMLPSVHGDAVDAGDAGGSGPSFDIHNPALTPTMTREQCLAQIRERRGRARSAAGSSASSSGSGSGSASGASATATSGPGGQGVRRPVTPGKERREVSAPVRRVASVRRVRP